MTRAPALPLETPPRRRDGHGITPETWPFYYAVLALRRRGHRVYRAGDMTHSLDGRRVGRGEIMRAAADLKQAKKETENGH